MVSRSWVCPLGVLPGVAARLHLGAQLTSTPLTKLAAASAGVSSSANAAAVASAPAVAVVALSRVRRLMRPAAGVGGCGDMVGPFLPSAVGETSRSAESGSVEKRLPGARRVMGATGAQGQGVGVARAIQPMLPPSVWRQLRQDCCEWRVSERAALACQGRSSRSELSGDHRSVATKVRNRITTNRRCITQLPDRARSCQPLLTDPMEEAVRSCGRVFAVPRLRVVLKNRLESSQFKCPFRRNAATGTRLCAGISSAHTRTHSNRESQQNA